MNWIDRKMALLGEAVDSKLQNLGLFCRRHRVGIYGTIIIHLLVAILFLSLKIASVRNEINDPISIDFEKEQVDPDILKEKVIKELAQLQSEIAALGQSDLRNTSADVSKESKSDKQPLSDDRNTQTDKLYDEARQLQERLEAGKANLAKLEQSEDGTEELKGRESAPKKGKVAAPGKVLVNYDLGGRKAYRLPVPAYTCEGGGEVKVIIVVSKDGYVVSAKIEGKNSNADECLWTSALRSAKMSRFQIVENPVAGQMTGYILYRFVPQ